MDEREGMYTKVTCRQLFWIGRMLRPTGDGNSVTNQPRQGWCLRAIFGALVWAIILFPEHSIAQTLPGLDGSSKSESPSEPNVIEIDGAKISETYERWLTEIKSVEAEITARNQQPKSDEVKVDSLVDRIRKLTDEVDKAAADAQGRIEEPTNALVAIGEPPTSDQPPEATIIAEERKRHQRALAKIQAELTFVQLIKARAETATGLLANYGENRWADWVSARENLAALFRDHRSFVGFAGTFRKLKTENLWFGHSTPGVWFPILVALVALGASIAALLLIKVVPKFGDGGRWETLDDRRELALVRLAAALGYGVFPSIVCIAIASLAIYFAPILGQELGIVAGLLFGLAVYVWLYRIFKIALEPTNEQARFLRGSDQAAHRISKLLQGLCVLIAVFLAGYLVLGFAVNVGAGTLVILKLATVLGLSGYALFASILSVFGEKDSDKHRRFYKALRIAAAIIGITVLIAALAGYVNFAVFASVHLAGSILLVASTFFIWPMLHDGIRALFSSDARSFAEPRRGVFEALIHLALDLAVAIMFLVLLLALWGVPFDAVWLWIKQATNALSIGKFRFGLSDLVAATVAFVIALIILRLLVRVIRHQVLERINIDIGIRESVVTILGYTSFLIALIVAIATLGVDVTSLALVFGALFLGVGFGLQNLVDNLVSGFIILFQRPIKSGDWINVGDHEGLVRKTGLVSTEVATFDDASIVLPNSEIVSSAVLNRTLGRTQGRVDVPVGVAYGSDVGTVLKVLRDCAASNDDVLSEPEPTVVLKDFSDSSLDFELRAFVADIRDIFEIASELRIEILEKFHEFGVEIPFPQRDVWLKNADTKADETQASADEADEIEQVPTED